jgi:hypothetical protein
MKSLTSVIEESSRRKYELYYSEKRSIKIVCLGDKNPDLDEELTYKDINDAVKAIYTIDPICDIAIIPYDKLTKFVLNDFR